jgi:hypothetical protein
MTEQERQALIKELADLRSQRDKLAGTKTPAKLDSLDNELFVPTSQQNTKSQTDTVSARLARTQQATNNALGVAKPKVVPVRNAPDTGATSLVTNKVNVKAPSLIKAQVQEAAKARKSSVGAGDVRQYEADQGNLSKAVPPSSADLMALYGNVPLAVDKSKLDYSNPAVANALETPLEQSLSKGAVDTAFGLLGASASPLIEGTAGTASILNRLLGTGDTTDIVNAKNEALKSFGDTGYAAASGVRSGAIPATVGMPAAAAGAKIGARLGAKRGLAGEAVGGFVGGLAGMLGAGPAISQAEALTNKLIYGEAGAKLQEQQTAEAQQANPMAFALGSQAPQLLYQRPSFGVSRTEILNKALGAGVGAGIPALGLLHGAPVSATDILAGGIAGGLLTGERTKPGDVLHKVGESVVPDGGKLQSAVGSIADKGANILGKATANAKAATALATGMPSSRVGKTPLDTPITSATGTPPTPTLPEGVTLADFNAEPKPEPKSGTSKIAPSKPEGFIPAMGATEPLPMGEGIIAGIKDPFVTSRKGKVATQVQDTPRVPVQATTTPVAESTAPIEVSTPPVVEPLQQGKTEVPTTPAPPIETTTPSPYAGVNDTQLGAKIRAAFPNLSHSDPTVRDKSGAIINDALTELRNRGVVNGKGLHLSDSITDKDSLAKAAHDAFALTDEQSSHFADMVDDWANGWAKKTGKTAADFYDSIGGIHRFDDDLAGLVYGKAGKGLRWTATDKTHAVIASLRRGDVTTAVHEMAHHFLDSLPESDRRLIDDAFADNENVKKAASPSAKTNLIEELWSSGVEAGLANPNHPLHRLYSKFKDWMQAAYAPVINKLARLTNGVHELRVVSRQGNKNIIDWTQGLPEGATKVFNDYIETGRLTKGGEVEPVKESAVSHTQPAEPVKETPKTVQITSSKQPWEMTRTEYMQSNPISRRVPTTDQPLSQRVALELKNEGITYDNPKDKRLHLRVSKSETDPLKGFIGAGRGILFDRRTTDTQIETALKRFAQEYNDATGKASGLSHNGVFLSANRDFIKWLGFTQGDNLLPSPKMKTRAEVMMHDEVVEAALKKGEPVPQEVLREYPQLAAKYGRAIYSDTPTPQSEPKPSEPKEQFQTGEDDTTTVDGIKMSNAGIFGYSGIDEKGISKPTTTIAKEMARAVADANTNGAMYREEILNGDNSSITPSSVTGKNLILTAMTKEFTDKYWKLQGEGAPQAEVDAAEKDLFKTLQAVHNVHGQAGLDLRMMQEAARATDPTDPGPFLLKLSSVFDGETDSPAFRNAVNNIIAQSEEAKKVNAKLQQDLSAMEESARKGVEEYTKRLADAENAAKAAQGDAEALRIENAKLLAKMSGLPVNEGALTTPRARRSTAPKGESGTVPGGESTGGVSGSVGAKKSPTRARILDSSLDNRSPFKGRDALDRLRAMADKIISGKEQFQTGEDVEDSTGGELSDFRRNMIEIGADTLKRGATTYERFKSDIADIVDSVGIDPLSEAQAQTLWIDSKMHIKESESGSAINSSNAGVFVRQVTQSLGLDGTSKFLDGIANDDGHDLTLLTKLINGDALTPEESNGIARVWNAVREANGETLGKSKTRTASALDDIKAAADAIRKAEKAEAKKSEYVPLTPKDAAVIVQKSLARVRTQAQEKKATDPLRKAAYTLIDKINALKKAAPGQLTSLELTNTIKDAVTKLDSGDVVGAHKIVDVKTEEARAKKRASAVKKSYDIASAETSIKKAITQLSVSVSSTKPTDPLRRDAAKVIGAIRSAGNKLKGAVDPALIETAANDALAKFKAKDTLGALKVMQDLVDKHPIEGPKTVPGAGAYTKESSNKYIEGVISSITKDAVTKKPSDPLRQSTTQLANAIRSATNKLKSVVEPSVLTSTAEKAFTKFKAGDTAGALKVVQDLVDANPPQGPQKVKGGATSLPFTQSTAEAHIKSVIEDISKPTANRKPTDPLRKDANRVSAAIRIASDRLRGMGLDAEITAAANDALAKFKAKDVDGAVKVMRDLVAKYPKQGPDAQVPITATQVSDRLAKVVENVISPTATKMTDFPRQRLAAFEANVRAVSRKYIEHINQGVDTGKISQDQADQFHADMTQLVENAAKDFKSAGNSLARHQEILRNLRSDITAAVPGLERDTRYKFMGKTDAQLKAEMNTHMEADNFVKFMQDYAKGKLKTEANPLLDDATVEITKAKDSFYAWAKSIQSKWGDTLSEEQLRNLHELASLRYFMMQDPDFANGRTYAEMLDQHKTEMDYEVEKALYKNKHWRDQLVTTVFESVPASTGSVASFDASMTGRQGIAALPVLLARGKVGLYGSAIVGGFNMTGASESMFQKINPELAKKLSPHVVGKVFDAQARVAANDKFGDAEYFKKFNLAISDDSFKDSYPHHNLVSPNVRWYAKQLSTLGGQAITERAAWLAGKVEGKATGGDTTLDQFVRTVARLSDGKLTAEQLQKRADNMIGLGERSEAGNRMFLKTLRFKMFMALTGNGDKHLALRNEINDPNAPPEAVEAAKKKLAYLDEYSRMAAMMTNVLTGKGHIEEPARQAMMNNIAKFTAIWSPTFWLSRVQNVSGYTLAKTLWRIPEMQKAGIGALDIAKIASYPAVMMGIELASYHAFLWGLSKLPKVQVLGTDDDKKSIFNPIGLDPMNTDMGKVKFGDAEYDFSAGHRKHVVAAIRLASVAQEGLRNVLNSTRGQAPADNEYDPYTNRDAYDRNKSKGALVDYVTGSTIPLASTMWNTAISGGKDPSGRAMGVNEMLLRNILPMPISNPIFANLDQQYMENEGRKSELLMAEAMKSKDSFAKNVFFTGLADFIGTTSNMRNRDFENIKKALSTQKGWMKTGGIDTPEVINLRTQIRNLIKDNIALSPDFKYYPTKDLVNMIAKDDVYLKESEGTNILHMIKDEGALRQLKSSLVKQKAFLVTAKPIMTSTNPPMSLSFFRKMVDDAKETNYE